MTLTLKLIKALKMGVQEEKLPLLIAHAKRNKVLLGLLRRFRVRGLLRDRQERAYALVKRAVEEVYEVIEPFNACFFKFLKPVEYVPADLDVLVEERDRLKVEKILLKRGYRVLVREPYCTTLKKHVLVDLYVHPVVLNIAYLDGHILLRYTHETSFNGLRVRALKPGVEALVTVAHAFYKVRLYTLSDHLTFSTWFNRETVELAISQGCVDVLKLALETSRAIVSGVVEAPVRVPFLTFTSLLLTKLSKSELSRRTAKKAPLKLFDRRLFNNLYLSLKPS